MTTPAKNAPEGVLYRKHRPQTLSAVLGQDHVVTVLTNALTEGRVAHAYLFAGPRGTGKTTVARILAKRLNCRKPRGTDPCGSCARCVAFAASSDLDLIEIDAASNRGIDEIRALKERIRLSPAAGAYKVYIVDEVHMLTKEAFNALLKTLEEPPAHAIFILATTDLHKVPDTIRSRCQTFQFRRAPVLLIEQRLADLARAEGATVEDEARSLIALHSEGCFRDAESILGQALATPGKAVTAQDVQQLLGVTGFTTVQTLVARLLEQDALAALTLLRDVSEQGASLRVFADDVTRYLRAATSYAAAGVHSETFSPAVEEGLRVQAVAGSLTLLRLLRLFLRAKTELRDSLYEELPLELAVIEWCEQKDAPSRPVSGEALTAAAVSVVSAPAASAPAPPREGDALTLSSHNGTRPEPAHANAKQPDNPTLYEKVRSVWQSFLERSVTLNPLLLSTLEACVPVAVRGNTLYLVTTFSLYKERLTDMGVRSPLEDELESLLGEKLLLRVVDAKETLAMGLPEPQPQHSSSRTPAQDAPEPQSITADVVSLFGGEVVRD